MSYDVELRLPSPVKKQSLCFYYVSFRHFVPVFRINLKLRVQPKQILHFRVSLAKTPQLDALIRGYYIFCECLYPHGILKKKTILKTSFEQTGLNIRGR